MLLWMAPENNKSTDRKRKQPPKTFFGNIYSIFQQNIQELAMKRKGKPKPKANPQTEEQLEGDTEQSDSVSEASEGTDATGDALMEAMEAMLVWFGKKLGFQKAKF